MLCVHHCIFKLPLIHILLIFCLTGNAYIFLWTITVKVTSLTSDKGNICLTSKFLMCVFAFGGLELINSCDCPLAMWPRSKHTHTHTHAADHATLAVTASVPSWRTQQKVTAPKYHCRVPVSTLADATLIQSAMESHHAEWLSVGQHPRATVTVLWKLWETREHAAFFF